jgi:hypothetical protein
MTAEANVYCVDGCWTLTLVGQTDADDRTDRQFLNDVGVPGHVDEVDINQQGGATCACGATIGLDWGDD